MPGLNARPGAAILIGLEHAAHSAEHAPLVYKAAQNPAHLMTNWRLIWPKWCGTGPTLPADVRGATGLEHPAKVPEKPGVTEKRGTDSGTLGGDSSFADAVAAVMRLPLSDAEKAEAVRRLLSRKGRAQ